MLREKKTLSRYPPEFPRTHTRPAGEKGGEKKIKMKGRMNNSRQDNHNERGTKRRMKESAVELHNEKQNMSFDRDHVRVIECVGSTGSRTHVYGERTPRNNDSSTRHYSGIRMTPESRSSYSCGTRDH